MANELNEPIKDILKNSSPSINYRDVQPLKWEPKTYQAGTPIYITIDGINYYYVAKTTVPATSPPPNTAFWIADQCSKNIAGCKLRWGANTKGAQTAAARNGYLPFGGFPAITSNY